MAFQFDWQNTSPITTPVFKDIIPKISNSNIDTADAVAITKPLRKLKKSPAITSLGDVAPIVLPEMEWTTPTTPTGETPSAEPQSGAMHAGFVSALMKLQQKARAMGGATAPDDLATVAKGYFGEAAERIFRKKGLALQERGLDIEDRRITSAERMHELGLISEAELERQKLISAENMYKAGRISEAELERVKTRAAMAMHKEEIELGYYQARTQQEAAGEAMEETGGLFGGGGFLGLGCIIISTCTSPESHEVNLAREYRDKWLRPVVLAGYYALSHKVVPLIVGSKTLKRLVKKFLVDRLTDYFEWFLGYKPRRRLHTSEYVTRNFLRLCKSIGSQMTRQRAVEYLTAHAGRTSLTT